MRCILAQKPYFQQALASSLFKLQQQCSFFALENSNWVIVGLDSAYYANEEGLYMDGSLQPSGGPMTQVDFLRGQVAKGKKVIVLTHHNGLAEDGLSSNNLWSQVMTALPCWVLVLLAGIGGTCTQQRRINLFGLKQTFCAVAAATALCLGVKLRH